MVIANMDFKEAEGEIERCMDQIKGLGNFKTFFPRQSRQQLDQAIEWFEAEGVVRLEDVLVKGEWNRFIEQTTRSGIVIVENHPSNWAMPTRISCVRKNTYLMEASTQASAYSKEHFQYNRKVENFNKRAFCMIGDEYNRACFVQSLYAFGFDKECEIYHPAYIKTHIENNFLGINTDLSPLQVKKLEPHHRFDFERNLPVVEKVVVDNDIEFVLPNRCLEDPASISEKDLYNVVFGIPALHVLDDGLKTLMKDYDFKVITPQGKDILQSSMEWLALFCRLTDVQRQRFQDDHAEDMIHNQRSLKNLSDLLLEHFKEDFKRL